MIPLRSTSCFSPSIVLRCKRYPKLLNSAPWKAFSSSSRWELKTTDMKETDWNSLKVNRERMWKELHDTCQWGKGVPNGGKNPTDIGMARLALSASDKKVRDWFVSTTKSLGCKVHIDEMGNIFAIRPGIRDGPATFAGSHLDTQPSGGRYDGILGIHAGIEALRVMNENQIETTYPTGVINWTNEEGARFPISMVASGVWAGEIPLERAYSLKEVNSAWVSMKSELEKRGYLGEVPCSHETGIPIAAHFELHIEQGPILASSGGKIGVVQGVQSYKWFTITVKGRECHTGTTDFKNRSDALLTASKLILHSHIKASQLNCLASTGILELGPGSTNTVPGWVKFSLDIRAPSDSKLAKLEKALQSDFDKMAAGAMHFSPFETHGKKCRVGWKLDTDSPAVSFHADCISCVKESAASLLQSESSFEEGNLVQEMISGAGHDSVYVSKRSPTAMIFVPCKDGVSHNPAEYCSQEDCGNGADVLLGAMLRYDRLRAEKELSDVATDLAAAATGALGTFS